MDKGVPGMDLVTGVLEPDSRLRSSPSVLVDADSLLSREGERDLPQGRDSIGKCFTWLVVFTWLISCSFL